MKTSKPRSLRFRLIFLIFIICIGPTVKLIGQPVTFDLKKLPEKTRVKLSEIGATEIKYVPLETTPQSLISKIRRIVFGKDFFLTQNFTEINMFRYDGSFITKLGTIGRGPNEFTVAHDVDINPKTGSIYIADGWQQKFLVFNKAGKVIRTFKTPLTGSLNFQFTDDGILCYNQNHMANVENSYILIDTMGKRIKNFPNRYPWKSNGPTVAFIGENIFYRYSGNLLKKEIYSDTIYTYKNKGFEPHLIIEAGKLRLTPAAREKTDMKYIMNNFLTPVNLFEFGNCIYYEFLIPYKGKSEGLSYIGSKKGKINVLFDPEKDLINDIDAGPDIWPRTATGNATMVSWIDALQFKHDVQLKSLKPPSSEKTGKLEKLAGSIKETDNPVLVFIDFK